MEHTVLPGCEEVERRLSSGLSPSQYIAAELGVRVTSVYRSQALREISENDIDELVSNLALGLTKLGFKE